MKAVSQCFPGLGSKLPYLRLGDFPSPIARLARTGQALDLDALFIKRDDVVGSKVRKLEVLLAQALRRGAAEVLTFGTAGSSHVAALATYARQLGLSAISLLVPQPNAYYVRTNLRVGCWEGAKLHHYTNRGTLVLGLFRILAARWLACRRFPFIIPAGGSSPWGTLGFVDAAFELQQQVKAGLLPEPDYLYVATGTLGTAIGLCLGLKLARMKTRVVPVRVLDRNLCNEQNAGRLFRRTAALLRQLDPGLPHIRLKAGDFTLRDDLFGEGYAVFSAEALSAGELVEQNEGLHLEPTYTGKAFAAIIRDAARLRGKSVLFWHTGDVRAPPAEALRLDYHQLPRALHCYFERDVQALDRPRPFEVDQPGTTAEPKEPAPFQHVSEQKGEVR